jgi:hypothetical protein
MCRQCHNKRVRGGMGELGLECVECHMPHKSGGVAGESHGHRRTQRFRINATTLKAADNVEGGYWKSTDLNGDSFLTLDMVCADCHANMSIEHMANYAKSIHRQPRLVDLTVNAGDALQVLRKNDPLRVDFSIEAGDKNGMKAEWWVICQRPKGWSSWNGKKWVAGLRPWRKNAPLTDVPEQNVLKAWAQPGHYTYWICVYLADGSEYFDSVPVHLTKR